MADTATGYLNARPARNRSGLPTQVLGMLMFIASELMFFAGLISAYLVTSAGAEQWPPAGQPRLPIEATALNTLVLLGSGAMMFFAGKAFREDPLSPLARKRFRLALGMGIFFVLFQGWEWIELIGHGFTLQSSVMGGFFYLIVGTHALHAVGAIIAMYLLYRRLRSGSLSAGAFSAGQMFWYFVVGIWPVLYGLVYLS